MSHILHKKYEKGHGTWQQCKDCGTTFHSGCWWLGGYKSTEEPACTPYRIDADWKKNATSIEHDYR